MDCRRNRGLGAIAVLFGVLGVMAVGPAPVAAYGAGRTETHANSRLEIFSWWTAGGEAEGLAAMFELFAEKHPSVQLINAAVAGGAGTNAKAVLDTRMRGGNPPDSFQVHAGHELIDAWVVPGKMEPITFIFRDNGWLNAFPKDLIEIISYKGEIYSVPVNIHRSNVLWYNKRIFAENHLAAPRTFGDLLKACEALAGRGVTPLALGDNGIWTSVHLLESVLLGTMGPDRYKGLWTGATPWDGPEVRSALARFAALMR
ncbi:MAG TPA: ABC transporter substrate-binding protein, partial [Spirochaetia bacterium]|nr:ABC transporter substrate-binding protein [Spirochaetia bacterium]